MQTKMIEKQLEIALKKLSPSSNDLLGQLRTIHSIRVALNQPVDSLHDKVWSVYKKIEDNAFVKLEQSPNLSVLASPIAQLADYRQFIKETTWKGEEALAEVFTET